MARTATKTLACIRFYFCWFDCCFLTRLAGSLLYLRVSVTVSYSGDLKICANVVESSSTIKEWILNFFRNFFIQKILKVFLSSYTTFIPYNSSLYAVFTSFVLKRNISFQTYDVFHTDLTGDWIVIVHNVCTAV